MKHDSQNNNYILKIADLFSKEMEGNTALQHYVNNYLAICMDVHDVEQQFFNLSIITKCYELIVDEDQDFLLHIKTQYELNNKQCEPVLVEYIEKLL